MDSLKTEFLNNFSSNDKFNKYIKLINKGCIIPNDPKYAEFHKFITILDEMTINVDDDYDEY